jgi:hypothetical protein
MAVPPYFFSPEYHKTHHLARTYERIPVPLSKFTFTTLQTIRLQKTQKFAIMLLSIVSGGTSWTVKS